MLTLPHELQVGHAVDNLRQPLSIIKLPFGDYISLTTVNNKQAFTWSASEEFDDNLYRLCRRFKARVGLAAMSLSTTERLEYTTYDPAEALEMLEFTSTRHNLTSVQADTGWGFAVTWTAPFTALADSAEASNRRGRMMAIYPERRPRPELVLDIVKQTGSFVLCRAAPEAIETLIYANQEYVAEVDQ
jgi:hypothetical protein